MQQLWLVLAVAASTLLVILLLLRPSTYAEGAKVTSVQIVVLGDIGRSPRMQYHAASVAQHGGLVQLIGYSGTYISGNTKAETNHSRVSTYS